MDTDIGKKLDAIQYSLNAIGIIAALIAILLILK